MFSYVLSYFDKNNPSLTNILDLILSTNVDEDIEVAVNFDHQNGQNKDGYGVAFYVIPKFGNISLPVRLESFGDNGSGAYGGNAGWDLAITPTYNSKSGYLRAEAFYYDYDNAEDPTSASYSDKSNTVSRVEAGFTF